MITTQESTNEKNPVFNKSYNKRKPLSEEHKKNLSISQKIRFENAPAPMLGRCHSEESKIKISKAHKGKPKSEEWKRKIGEANKGRVSPNKGKKFTDDHRRKLSESHKKMYEEDPNARVVNREAQIKYNQDHPEARKQNSERQIKYNKDHPQSEDIKKKKSETMKKYYIDHPEARIKMSEKRKGKLVGDKNPSFGRIVPQEERERRSKSMKGKLSGSKNPMFGKTGDKNPSFGRIVPQETIEKISGKNNYNWKGGSSFEPYCPKFNNEFKKRVRAFFGYQCVECGTPQNGKKLVVHHVNFNKLSCCDTTIPLFVSLCASCHGKTNHKREYWEQHFTDIIKNYYEGKCYFTKDEMETITKDGLTVKKNV
jgi:hypothetical protein